MTPEERQEWSAEITRREGAAQGLPEKIEDPRACELPARLIMAQENR